MGCLNMSDEGIPACDKISHHVIPTERAGALSVWVQGDLSLVQKAESRDSCCCFMTVHDVGVNHNSWLRFINSPSMGTIREKAVFLHVDLLGELLSNNALVRKSFEQWCKCQKS